MQLLDNIKYCKLSTTYLYELHIGIAAGVMQARQKESHNMSGELALPLSLMLCNHLLHFLAQNNIMSMVGKVIQNHLVFTKEYKKIRSVL